MGDLGATRREQREEYLLKRILGPRVKNEVKKTVKLWNAVTRQAMRTETGLWLARSDDARTSVKVKVVDGLPPAVKKLIAGIDDPVLWDFILHRGLLRYTGQGLTLIAKHWKSVPQLLAPKSPSATKDELDRVTQLVYALYSLVRGHDIGKRIMALPVDPLGLYYIDEHRIEIYWMSIGLLARNEGFDIEDLTAVVLAHELAHAFSHVGFDIDENQWSSKTFARTRPEIIEGLAQFYTGAVCERMAERRPSPVGAFKHLLDNQEGPYLAHKDWTAPNESAGEIVRKAMVEYRMRPEGGYERFRDLLMRARRDLGSTTKRRKRDDLPADPDVGSSDDGQTSFWDKT